MPNQPNPCHGAVATANGGRGRRRLASALVLVLATGAHARPEHDAAAGLLLPPKPAARSTPAPPAVLAASAPASPGGMEAGLVEVLRPDPARPEYRRGATDAALAPYIRAGLVNRKPDATADYSDYRVLKRPTTLLGHRLVMIDEEYSKGDIGCCVDPGIAVTLQAGSTDQDLAAFARANTCKLTPSTGAEFPGMGLAIPRGRYVTLACKTRILVEAAAAARNN